MSIGLRRAQERVERVLDRVAMSDMPLMGAVSDLEWEAKLEQVRDLARRRAIRAGRGELLDEAWDRVASGYASRLGDGAGWMAMQGVPVREPFVYGAEDRVASQIAIGDLVLAAAAEDLLTPEEHALLSATGERMLDPGDELPLDWTPPPEATQPERPVVSQARAWPRSELLGATLLVTLAMIVGWVAADDPLAGVGLGLGAAAFLFLWRRDPKPPDGETG
jgi:hypothetical protein